MKGLYVIFGVVFVFSIILVASFLFLSKKQAGSQFLSWQGKSGVKVLSSGSVVVWQDGPFLYKAKRGSIEKIGPLLVRGVVRKIDGRTFEITNSESGKPLSVSVKLLEGGDAILLRTKNGEVAEQKGISYQDIKLDNKVEFHSLKFLGDNLYGSLQVFLITSQ